jgi:hypothetical protein
MEAAGGYVDKAVDFTMEQAPLVVKEYVTWIFWSAVINAIMWVICITALICLSVFIWKRAKGIDDDCARGFTYALSLALLIPAFFMVGDVGSNTKEAVKAAVAPRVLLIEKATEMVRGVSSSKPYCSECGKHHN